MRSKFFPYFKIGISSEKKAMMDYEVIVLNIGFLNKVKTIRLKVVPARFNSPTIDRQTIDRKACGCFKIDEYKMVVYCQQHYESKSY